MESIKHRSNRLTKMLATSSALLPAVDSPVILDGLDSMFHNSVANSDNLPPPTVCKTQKTELTNLSLKKTFATKNPFKMVDMRKRPP